MTEMQMGSNIALPDTAVRVTLQWSAGGGVPDVDASALLLQATGEVAGDADFVFYNQPQHPSGAVRLTGKSPGSDPVDIDLTRLPAGVERVVLAAAVDTTSGGTFGQVPQLRITLNDVGGAPLAGFAMSATNETAFVCGEVYHRNGQWKFRAVGQGYASGLAGLAADFGIQTGQAPPAAPAAAPPPATPAATPSPAAAPPPPPAAPPPATPPRAPAVPAAGALDLDAPWPPR